MKWYHEEWFQMLVIFILFNAFVLGIHYLVLEVF
jgi:hypothetical protein